MPKKSDRPEHESAMSSLLPDVSLDEESPQDDEGQELENSRTKEEKNYSSAEPSSGDGSEANREGENQGSKAGSSDPQQISEDQSEMPVLPERRPELDQKIGPYVSDDVNEALEEVYLTLRRRFGKKASKSLIVEAALRYFLNDSMRRGKKGEISKWMRRVLDSA
ncbi:hypothetical protein [Salinibacter grassmerensis]|uniref:hypothetical protein n=1 Tax=Salinibacter grassmerensis TaxID=3040353 RepID=UPI0021E91ED4|nr:hypothetical protein [Salinibacter grassmerensis]